MTFVVRAYKLRNYRLSETETPRSADNINENAYPKTLADAERNPTQPSKCGTPVDLSFPHFPTIYFPLYFCILGSSFPWLRKTILTRRFYVFLARGVFIFPILISRIFFYSLIFPNVVEFSRYNYFPNFYRAFAPFSNDVGMFSHLSMHRPLRKDQAYCLTLRIDIRIIVTHIKISRVSLYKIYFLCYWGTGPLPIVLLSSDSYIEVACLCLCRLAREIDKLCYHTLTCTLPTILNHLSTRNIEINNISMGVIRYVCTSYCLISTATGYIHFSSFLDSCLVRIFRM